MSGKYTRIALDAAFDGDRTDWARLRKLNDCEIDAAIAGDEDSYPLDDAELAAHSEENFAYQVYRASDSRWHWRLTDRSGQILAQSHGGFATRDAVQEALAHLRLAVLGAKADAA